MNIQLIPLYRFWIQVVTIALVLAFCGYGLVSGDRRNGNLYSNLAYLMLGYLFPSPGGQSKKEGDQIAIDSNETNVYPDSK